MTTKVGGRDIKKQLLAVIAAVLVVNAGVLFFIIDRQHNAAAQKPTYPLLEKTLSDSNSDIIINFDPLRNKLHRYFAENVAAEYSFYVEYLPTGTSIRIDDDKGLIGASLLKLPIVMDLYKARELGRISLDQTISIQPEWLDTNFGELYKRGAGTKLTLREAVEETLHNSDNTALNAVYSYSSKNIPPNESAVNEIDAPFSVTPQEQIQISAKSYTSILKCLYYACYNSKADSQQILKLLTEAPDSGRIAAPLPDNIPVAHKIGSFNNSTQSDCGIVYAPNRNYTFCMMINLPEDEANRHIEAVSEMTYDYISNK